MDKLDLTENTIVLFLTDNGPNGTRYVGNLRGQKGSVYEGGVRVPLFIRWPGKIVPKSHVKQIAAPIDLLPTLTDMCGVPVEHQDKLDGISLEPLLISPSVKSEKVTKIRVDWPDRLIYTWW